MSLLFVLLALAVLAGVALVAAGRGDVLAEASPDLHPVTLPEGRVTADDLEAVRFPVVFRGYRMVDVDRVLDRLTAELAERDSRIRELESPRVGGRHAAGQHASGQHASGQHAPGQSDPR